MSQTTRELIWYRFKTVQEADKGLSHAVADAMFAGYRSHESAVLSLSGGRSPRGFLRELAFRFSPWPAAKILLVDDRQTDKWATPRSNAGFIQSIFSDTPASMAEFIPPVPEGARVASLDETGPDPKLLRLLRAGSDALVLGMGEDGHFASLFPGADRLEEAFDPDAEPTLVPMTAPGADEPRVTQNYAAINKSSNIFLQLPNETKIKVFNDILEGRMKETPMGRFISLPGPPLQIFAVDA